MPEYTSGSSIRAERTPPRKSKQRKQVVDFQGFPLSTEEGNPLTSEKDVYELKEYGSENAPSVVVDSNSYLNTGISTQNKFSKSTPAALPIEEQFQEQSAVSRSLLGINRETSQQGIFGNVSTYGLDEKDWRVDGTPERTPEFWYQRNNNAGKYYNTAFIEDTTNSALAIFSNPSPFTPPGKPSLQDQLLSPGGGERYSGWGQYINSVIAKYLVEYMIKNFTDEQKTEYNLNYLLSKYPPARLSDGSYVFNPLYWDQIWLDINQKRFGAKGDSPLIPSGRAFNFVPTDGNTLRLENFRSAALWGEGGEAQVIISEANAAVPSVVDCGWDSFFFGATRVFYPVGSSDFGHYEIQTNPAPDLWSKYFGLRWEYLRQDLKDWKFTVHETSSTVTQVEKDFKLPYFVLDPLVPDPDNIFSDKWPSEAYGLSINLPTNSNRPGGLAGIDSQITIKSLRAFRYQPGRISGFTYGTKVSEIGAGSGTVIEWGVENDTDAYLLRLSNGANFSIVRQSIIPLEETLFLENSGYAENTRTIVKNGRLQYETVIEQKSMNGDPLNGEGESGYILNLDTVTMYKIEFGWYGAIGARFYAYIPEENGECRWVVLHTLVIENQIGQPCLGDPFFYFRYRLKISDSSTIRVNQFLYKFGASYYIDGYDQGTLYSSFAASKMRLLNDPKFTVSKTSLNAIDWTVLMGIKPKQYLFNRFGTEVYNKKEIFPKSFSIYSQQDCEVKIIRQKACPEFAYTHQEGYQWDFLPENRRIKGKFSINPYYRLTDPDLGIDADNGSTHSAIMSWSAASPGAWRDPTVESNFDIVRDEYTRLVGQDLFNVVPVQRNEDTFKLYRADQYQIYLSSRDPSLDVSRVYLPFTYAPIAPNQDGYDVEFDYFRRDQIILSNVDIVNDEFFLFWAGGELTGLDSTHSASMRIGFVWPDVVDTDSPIYKDRDSNDWGMEIPEPGQSISYDGQKFYEGLPVDFVNDYPSNSLYIETVAEVYDDTFNVERAEGNENYGDFFDLEKGGGGRLASPGVEGGTCQGLGCKAGLEIRTNITVTGLEEETSEGVTEKVYYLQDTKSAWPSLGEPYAVSVTQNNTSITVNVSNPISKTVDDVVVYLLPLGTALPIGLSEGKCDVSYNIIYIATIDKKSNVRSVLVAKVAPGDLPFVRLFIQARQGTSLGGLWVGQKTPNGIILDPFTPHRSTVNILDNGAQEKSGQYLAEQYSDGAVKVIRTITQPDSRGLSTAPTFDASADSLNTKKSINTSPAKCGSFLSSGGTNAAGILTPTDYPIRWLTAPNSGSSLSTYYISRNESVEILLDDIFNVDAESIVNSDDANLATIFIARSLENHTPEDSQKEIYMTLNYDEQ